MCGGGGGGGGEVKYFYSQPTSQQVKQKAKWAAVEDDQNASITKQLVKQKAKWAAIEDDDHNASNTTHTDKKKTKTKKKKKKKTQRATKSKNNTRTTALERSVEEKKKLPGVGGGVGGAGEGFKALLQLAYFTLGPDATLNTEIHKNSVRIKAHNSVNASKRKHKNKLITVINKDEYSWLILLYARVNENQ